MTARQFLALGETTDRYELVNGVVLTSPSASFRHNDIVAEIITELRMFARQHPGTEVVPDTDVRLSDREVYRPDVLAYRAGRFRRKPEQLREPPDLIIEVLSPGNQAMDLVTKLADYGRFGVGEYWVVDPSVGTLRCWRRKGRKLVESRVTGASVKSTGLPGFTLDLAQLRAHVGLPPVRLRRR